MRRHASDEERISMKRKLIIAALLVLLINVLQLNLAFAEIKPTVEADAHYILSEGMVFSFDENESLSFNERVQLQDNQLPIKSGDKTYLPFRFVMDNFKAIVKYEAKTGKIFAEHGIQKTEMKNGSDVFYVDDRRY